MFDRVNFLHVDGRTDGRTYANHQFVGQSCLYNPTKHSSSSHHSLQDGSCLSDVNIYLKRVFASFIFKTVLYFENAHTCTFTRRS